MATLSYIDTNPKKPTSQSFRISTDESIGAILFDISGFENPFDGYSLLYHSFMNNKVQCIKNMDDALLVGIEDNDFLNGLVYYHLSQFYDFIGEGQTLYVAIADCSKDWGVIESIQRQANGRIFQIGVWTPQPLWKIRNNGSLDFTSLITDLQAQADEINGKIGEPTHTMVPLNIILCGNSSYAASMYGEVKPISYKELPDAIALNCAKVSVPLVQNGTPEVKEMQSKNPLQAPVSALGIIMACLALCGAEESIASITKCDLNKNDGFNNPEWGVGATGTPIGEAHRIWTNVISSRGYIVPVNYEEMEASYFLSSDQTLSENDFRTIANNRVMHKCRRATCTATIPYIHGNHIYNPGTRNISLTSIAIITDSINTLLDSVMRNKQGQKQIEGRVVTFLENEKMLENDAIFIKLDIKPANYSEYISEGVSHDIVQ